MRLPLNQIARGLFLTAVLLVSVIFFASTTSYAQTPSLLYVETNAPQSNIYLDSLRLGLASSSPWRVEPGTHRVIAVPPTSYSWSQPRPSVSIDVAPGDTVSATLHFPYSYSINSIPSGAAVLLEQQNDPRKLGQTPLTYTSETPLRSAFLIKKPGYGTAQVNPGSQLWNAHTVQLVGSVGPAAEDHVGLPPSEDRFAWLTYAAAGLAVTAGVAAVYFKRKANRYKQSGNPHLRAQSGRYETIAGGSLVAMQVGLGVLAVRLVLR